MGNPFDQFDRPAAGANPFDKFDDSTPKVEQNSGILGDTVTDVKRGFEQLPGALTGLADIVNPLTYTNNRRYFDEGADWIGKQTGFQPGKWQEEAAKEYSPERQASDEAVNKAWEQGGIGNIAETYLTRPRSIAGIVGQALPATAGGGFIARSAMKGIAALSGADMLALRTAAAAGDKAALTAINRMATTAGGIGEGAITAGMSMDQVSRDVDPSRAALTSATSGVLTGAIGKYSGRLANKLGLPDLETVMAGGGTGVGGMPWYKRIPSSIVQESLLQEFPQSAQEQIMQNIAEKKPWDEGVARASIEGALAGAAMGGGVAMLPQQKPNENATNTPPTNPLLAQATQTFSPQPGSTSQLDQTPTSFDVPKTLPPSGPLSSAVGIGRMSGAIPPEPVLRERDFVPPPSGSYGQLAEFENLLNSERADKQSRVSDLLSGQAVQAASEAESQQARVEAAQQQQSAQERYSLLQQVADTLPDGRNLKRAFGRALKEAGYSNLDFTPEETASIDNFNQINRSAGIAANIGPDIEPSTPNELDASQFIKEKGAKPEPKRHASNLIDRIHELELIESQDGLSPQQVSEMRGLISQLDAQVSAKKKGIAAPTQTYGAQPTRTTPLLQTATNLGLPDVAQAVKTKQGQEKEQKAPAANVAPDSKEPWKMSSQEYDSPVEKEKREIFYVRSGSNNIEVIRNPSGADLSDMKKEFRREFPNATKDDPALRHTEDVSGNSYYWKGHLGAHQHIEPEISKRYGVAVNQNAAQKMSHRYVVRRALYDGFAVPDSVIAEYPGIIEEVRGIEGNKLSPKPAPAIEQPTLPPESSANPAVTPQQAQKGPGLSRVSPKLLAAYESAKASGDKAEQRRLAKEINAQRIKQIAAAKEHAPVVLSLGSAPNSAEPITVKDGVVHVGNYPAQNFDTGENVTVANGATPQQIKAALSGAGAIGRGQKVFGLPKETAPNRQSTPDSSPKPVADAPSLQRPPVSWVIKNKATGEIILETYDKKKVDAINAEKYEAVPILEHLQSINKDAKQGKIGATPQDAVGVKPNSSATITSSPEVATKPMEDRERFERQLRAASAKNESPGDVLMGDLRYVPFDTAVKIAREAIESGDMRPFPAQMNLHLGMAMRDADRVLAAATKGNKPAQEEANKATAQESSPAPAQQIRSNVAPIMRRNDLVGAIMRVTGGNGIASSMSDTLIGEKANRVGNLRGLFTNRGQQDMGDIAMLLREEEGFDVKDGPSLEELIREAASGNVAKSMAVQEEEKAINAEKEHRQNIRDEAARLGIKSAFKKFDILEREVLARQAEEAQAVQSEAEAERAAIQAESAVKKSDDDQVNELLQLAVEDGRMIGNEWITNEEILAGFDATTALGEREDEAGASRTGEGAAREATGNSQEGSGQARAEVAPALTLEGQTLTEVNAQEKKRQADEAAAQRDDAPKGPNVTADQVDLFNTQGGLFNSNRDSQEEKAQKPEQPTAQQPDPKEAPAETPKAEVPEAKPKTDGDIVFEAARVRPFDSFESIRSEAIKTTKKWTEELDQAIHDGQYQGAREYARTLPVTISDAGISLGEASRAFNGTSMSPERRGASVRRGVFSDLMALWKRLENQYNAAPQDRKEAFVSAFNEMSSKYVDLTKAYLSAHGRVMSAFIVGPARFPVASNRKKSDTADKRASEANDYLNKAPMRLLKVLRGRVDNSLNAQITEAEEKLKAREDKQAQMKAINAAHGRFVKDEKSLDKTDFSEAIKKLIREYKPNYSWEPHPYPPYALTNNNAEIRRMRDRVAELKKRADAADAATEQEEAQAEDANLPARIVRNAAEGRLQILFAEKPSAEIRSEMKASGFRWSPRNEAWQRQLTDNAVRAAQEIIDKHFLNQGSATESDGNEPNLLRQEKSVYTVNEPSDISGDLFSGTEHEIPDTQRSGDSGKGKSKQGGSRVLALREAPETPGIYHVTTQLVTVGERSLPVRRVNTVKEAASVFASLTKNAVEHLDGLVTDKDGNPLAIIGSFKGEATSAPLYPSTLMMELSRIGGAANLWLAHNHPSGLPDLSSADRRMSASINKILEGSNIRYHGLLAMARTGNVVKFESDDYSNGEVSATQPEVHKIPIVEREIISDARGDQLSSAAATKAMLPKIAGGRPGVLFLTAQNEISAFVPFAPKEMGELRKDDRLMRLFGAASKAGAVNAIIAMPDGVVSGLQRGNLAGALSTIDVRVVDAIQYQSSGEGKVTSLAESGDLDHPGAYFMNAADKNETISKSDKAIYGMAAEGKSAKDILKFIAASSRNPFYRQLARILLKTGIAPNITVGDGKGFTFNAGNDKKYAASYDPKTDTVALFRPASSERHALHEFLHAATIKALSKKGMAAVQMRALFNHVKATGKMNGMYGMENVDEFVAEVFSNPKFQEALKKIAAPEGSARKTVWDRFISVIRGILGLKPISHDALSRALSLGLGVMHENMNLSEGKNLTTKWNVGAGSVGGGISSVLFYDGNENAIVWDDGDYRISVNMPGRSTSSVLWHKESVKGKDYWAKRGHLSTFESEKFGKKWLRVQEVAIEGEHRGSGLGLKLYQFLLDQSGADIAGILSHSASITNKKQVPAIHRKLGAKLSDSGDFYMITKPEDHVGAGSATINVDGVERPRLNSNGQFSPENNDIRYNVIGDSGREYDQAHRDFFKNVGRDINPESRLQKSLNYLRNDFWKKMAVGIVDQFRGLRDLGDNGTAYMLARLSKGTAGAFDTLLHHGKLTLRDGVYDGDTSGGFVERLGVPLHGELDDVLWWIAANRAGNLAPLGKENLFSPSDIAAGKSLANGTTTFDYTIQTGPARGTVTRNRSMIYADAHRVFNEFQKNTLDMAEQSGLIDGNSRKTWESEFYVPFYRVSEEDGEFVGAKISGSLVRKRAFQKLKGGTDKLNSDLLSNTLQNWAHLITASAQNRAARASLAAAENIGVAQRVAPDMASYSASNGTMLPPGTKKTVWFQENGKKVEYLVTDPFVMTAITSLEYAGMRNGIMDAMTNFKHALTIGVTASPAFKVRNLIRDSLQAIGTSDLGYNPIKNVTEGYKQTRRDSQEYVSALASGGLIRFGTMLEGSESSRVRQLIKAGVKDSTILNSDNKWQAFYDKVIDPAVSAYNELGNRSEEINRAALYNQLIKQGKSHAEAALLARDLMDFSMQGSFNTIRFLSQVVPFFNARLQGMYKLGRAARDDPKKMAVVTGALALASIALMAGYHDDDDWKRREDWDRDNYWWFKFGGIEYRIPKPFELGAVATLAERSVEYLTNDEMTGERFRNVIGKIAENNLSMNPVPQMVKPIIDLYANKDSFTGRPIETMGMQRLDSDMRFNSNTSMPARALSTATLGALSPVQYDHLARAYFGWIGATAVSSADMAARVFMNEPTKPALDYWKVATQGMMKEQGSGSSRYLTLLYDQASELEQAYGTYRQLLKDGKFEDAKDYYESNADKLKRYKFVNSVKSMETKLNASIRSIERSDASAEEKKARIERVQAMKERVAKRVAPGLQ